jgi:hypothetical protein
MRKKFWLCLWVGSILLSSLFCGANPVMPTETPTLELSSTATPIPIPPAPDSTPADLPESGELRNLVEYANALNPWLTQAGEILEQDAQILEEAEGGNDTVLCDGRLEQDNLSMKMIVDQIQLLSPPSEAAVIHELLLESGQAWTEALDHVEEFCDSGNQLHKIPAILKYWEAASKLQDAWNRFWILMVAKGLEDWVQR